MTGDFQHRRIEESKKHLQFLYNFFDNKYTISDILPPFQRGLGTLLPVSGVWLPELAGPCRGTPVHEGLLSSHLKFFLFLRHNNSKSRSFIGLGSSSTSKAGSEASGNSLKARKREFHSFERRF